MEWDAVADTTLIHLQGMGKRMRRRERVAIKIRNNDHGKEFNLRDGVDSKAL